MFSSSDIVYLGSFRVFLYEDCKSRTIYMISSHGEEILASVINVNGKEDRIFSSIDEFANWFSDLAEIYECDRRDVI